jgi:hypothetical protein
MLLKIISQKQFGKNIFFLKQQLELDKHLHESEFVLLMHVAQ